MIAREMDLDLVEVAPLANPPVCRIMDYGKFKFDEAQRAKESRRKSTNVSLKEMKYRLKIGPGDFDTKTRKVAGFLADGHKVKITIMFRGREVERPQYGKQILDRVADKVATVGKVEMVPRLDGRNMVMVLSPDKRAQAHAQQAARQAAAGIDHDGHQADGHDDQGLAAHDLAAHDTGHDSSEQNDSQQQVAAGGPTSPAAAPHEESEEI
jgi:translation initiation factor IF-3